jgi:hypothetical protein
MVSTIGTALRRVCEMDLAVMPHNLVSKTRAVSPAVMTCHLMYKTHW